MIYLKDYLVLIVGLRSRCDVVIDAGKCVPRRIWKGPDTLVLPQYVGYRIDHGGGNDVARERVSYGRARRAGRNRKGIADGYKLSG